MEWLANVHGEHSAKGSGQVESATVDHQAQNPCEEEPVHTQAFFATCKVAVVGRIRHYHFPCGRDSFICMGEFSVGKTTTKEMRSHFVIGHAGF